MVSMNIPRSRLDIAAEVTDSEFLRSLAHCALHYGPIQMHWKIEILIFDLSIRYDKQELNTLKSYFVSRVNFDFN